MGTRLLERPVAKRNDVPVKLDAEVVRIAKIVASYKEKSLAEYLSDLLLPLVERELMDEQGRYTGSRTSVAKPSKRSDPGAKGQSA